MTLEGNESLAPSGFDRAPSDPLSLLDRWLRQARDVGVAEPEALSLSTVDADGSPSSRVVLLKGLDAAGLVFSTSAQSQKGRDLAATGVAAGLLFWRETIQQVAFGGPVARLPDAESDAIFAARPRLAQAVAAVSRQSAPLGDEAALRAAVADQAASSMPIPRPDHWRAYRLTPAWMEFWLGRKDRLHRRLRYHRQETVWCQQRLQP